MATERQIAANRRNALRSTGPTTDQGKSACRLNALKHGLAAATIAAVDPARADEHRDRLEAWQAEIRPATVEAAWALGQAVAATFQIDQSERDFDALAVQHVNRARLCWDDDRRAEADDLAARLGKEPARVARRLATTKQGCELLIERWERLGEALEADGGWGDAEASAALDLLGVPPELRRGRTPVDRADGVDPSAFRAELVRRQVDRLGRKLAGSLDALDDLARAQAEVGALIPLTRPGQLLLRYRRDAWRRFDKAILAARAVPSESEPEAVAPIRVAPEPDEPEPSREPEPEPERLPTTPDEIRAMLEEIESRVRSAKTEGERSLALQELESALYLFGPELGLDVSSIVPGAAARSPNRHERRAMAARSRRG